MFRRSVLLFALLFSACAPRLQGEAVPGSIPASSLAEAQTIAKNAEARCADKSDCSPSVALLTEATEQAAFSCTAWLISNDIVATNSHCVPDDLKTAGASCKDRIWVTFPETQNTPGAQVECAEVIAASDLSDTGRINPDYAFLRLSRSTERPALEVDSSGFLENTSYSVMKMDPIPSSDGIPVSYLRTVNCKATGASQTSSIMTFENCPVMSGDSGAPILDAAGRVHGLIQAVPDHSNGSFPAIGTSYAGIRIPALNSLNN